MSLIPTFLPPQVPDSGGTVAPVGIPSAEPLGAGCKGRFVRGDVASSQLPKPGRQLPTPHHGFNQARFAPDMLCHLLKLLLSV